MDVGNVKGGKGVERNVDSPQRSEAARSHRTKHAAPAGDQARISDDFLARAEELTSKLRGDDPGRQEHVERVRGRYDVGALDQPEVYRETAFSMLTDEG